MLGPIRSRAAQRDENNQSAEYFKQEIFVTFSFFQGKWCFLGGKGFGRRRKPKGGCNLPSQEAKAEKKNFRLTGGGEFLISRPMITNAGALILLSASGDFELGALVGFLILCMLLFGGVWWVCRKDTGAS